MSIEAMKLAAEFNRYFTSTNGVDVPAKVSVSRDEWRALFTAIQQAESEPVGEPRARVELMKTGGNAGLSTRIIELDIATRERLRPGDLLYTHPAPGVTDALKDHQIAAMVNSLRDIARQFHGHDSLRERIANVLVPALKAEAQQPVTGGPVQADSSGHLRVIASLDAECNSLAHQLNASNERNGMLRVALSDCSAELFAQCGDQSRAMSYVNAARAALAQAQEVDERDWWTDADADAARLALELECLLLDTKDTAAVSRWWASANEALDLHRARLAAPQQAMPEPVAEVVWFDPQLDQSPRKSGHKIVDASLAFMDAAPLGTKLYAHPSPGVTDDVVRDAIAAVREQYRGTDLGKAAECICDAIDAAILAAKDASA